MWGRKEGGRQGRVGMEESRREEGTPGWMKTPLESPIPLALQISDPLLSMYPQFLCTPEGSSISGDFPPRGLSEDRMMT